MNTRKTEVLRIPVCEVSVGKSFKVEYMPEFLREDDFDNSAPHIHSFYEILWFQEGEGKHTVDFQEYEVTPNTLFFLSPGQIHHFDANMDYRGVSLKMCTDFMKNEGSNKIFLKNNIFHNYNSTPCYHLNNESAQELWQLVNQMAEETKHGSEYGNMDILQALLRIFLVKIHRYGMKEGELRFDTLKPSHQLFVNFRSLVEKEYMHMHTVQEYADQLNVAVRTLNKCVNDCSQMSPLAFINSRIILEAKRLVRYTNLLIKEIAFDLGYDDASYFVKFFKRQTGYMPSDFREMDI